MPADLLYRVARPFFFSLDAERAHQLVLGLGERAARHPALLSAARALYGSPRDPILGCRVFGLDFDNPVGLAAGLDKDGIAADLWAAIGFGFAELGTVTKGAGQPGNPRPRVLRLKKDRALLNRMGFNNHGAEALAERLRARRSHIPLGANLGKAKDTPIEDAAADYVETLRAVWSEASYVAINVSSPNTPGLRDLQAVESLAPLLRTVEEENLRLAAAHGKPRRPLLLKIAPDLADADLDAIADLALALRLDGLIATNTTKKTPGDRPLPFEGGVSGAPLLSRALEVTERLHRRLGGAIPIVGVGGIATAEDAYRRIRAGASLVQVYTALIYEGPALVRSLTSGLAARLRKDGFSSLAAAVGAG